MKVEEYIELEDTHARITIKPCNETSHMTEC